MSPQFLRVECAPCGRRGVWRVGGDVVVHERPDGATRACLLPPRDDDHLSERQRAALDAAIREELAKRAGVAAA